MDLQFLHPLEAGIFFVLSFGMIAFFLFQKKRKNFANIHILQKVFPEKKWKIVFFSLSFSISFFLSLCLAVPYTTQHIENIKKQGIDIEIVLDVSSSMYEQDLFPSRIDAAKTALSQFVSLLSSDRVGFVLYAGKPFQSVPLTFDYPFLQDFISQIRPENINQNIPGLNGTNIGDALILGVDSLIQTQDSEKEQKNREKIIILLTDGNANVGLDPKVASRYAAEKKVKIYTIGIGKNTLGQNAYTPEILESISKNTSGKFYQASNGELLQNIFSDIAKLEKTPLEYQQKVLYHEKIKWVLLAFGISFLALFYFIFIRPIRL